MNERQFPQAEQKRTQQQPSHNMEDMRLRDAHCIRPRNADSPKEDIAMAANIRRRNRGTYTPKNRRGWQGKKAMLFHYRWMKATWKLECAEKCK